MKTRTWAAGIAAAIPLLVAAAVPLLGGSASAQPTPATETPQPNRSDWPNQDRLSQAAHAVGDLGANRYPAVYGGVEMDVPADVLIVHRVPSTTGADDFDQAVRDTVRPVAAPSRVVIKAAQLYGWLDRLWNDINYWKAQGTPIHGMSARPGNNCVQIAIDEPDRDASRVQAHYDFPLCAHPASEVLFASTNAAWPGESEVNAHPSRR